MMSLAFCYVPKFHYGRHKRLPTDPILRPTLLVLNSHGLVLEVASQLVLSLHQGLSGIFPYGFQTKTVYLLCVSCVIRPTCFAQFMLPNLVSPIFFSK